MNATTTERIEPAPQSSSAISDGTPWNWNLKTGQMTRAPRGVSLFGYPTDKVDDSVDWWLSRIHPDDRVRIETALAAAIRTGGEHWTGRYRFRRADGADAHLLDTAVIIRDADGLAVRVTGQTFCVARDKGAAVNDEGRGDAERVRQSELVGLLESLLSFAPIGFAFFSRDLRFIRINPQLADMHNLSSQDLADAPLHEILPETASTLAPIIEKVFASGKPRLNIEFETSVNNGKRHWLSGLYPVFVGTGSPRYVGAVMMEISDQKANERELRVLTERLEERVIERTREIELTNNRLIGIIDGTTDLIAAVDLDYRFTAYNATFAQQLRTAFGAEIKVGDDVRTLLDRFPAEQAVTTELWSRALGGEEFTVVRTLGEGSLDAQTYEFTYNRILDDAGRQIGAAHVVRNISHRVKAERELRHLNEELERRVAERTRRISEVNAGLHSEIRHRQRTERQLRELANELERRVGARTRELETQTERLRHLANRLVETEQRERRRVAELIHDHLQQLLIAAKLKVGLICNRADDALKPVAQKAQNLLNEAIQSSRSLTAELRPPVLYESGLAAALRWLATRMEERHGLRVNLDLDEAAEPAEAIRPMLYHSIQEMLFNVVKYAETDEAFVKLALHREGRIWIRVMDRGKGFNPDIIGGSPQKPTGFGLFSIRERVKLLEGELKIESTPETGSELNLFIPMPAQADEEPASYQRPRKAAVSAPGRARTGGVRVLLADDHQTVREGIATLLAEADEIEVVGQASDGLDALEKARSVHPDVVVMDLNMPKMNGIEATRALKIEFPDVHVIGLSIHDDAETDAAMRQAGADAYLHKAVDPHTLVKTIVNVMRPVPELVSSACDRREAPAGSLDRKTWTVPPERSA